MKNKPASQQGIRQEFDVLVIGSGIAGLSYILELCEKSPEIKIALIVKKTLKESNSYYAQGGIAAVTTQEDHVDHHIQDTLNAGAGLSRFPTVKNIISQGKEAIDMLIRHGVSFAKQNNVYDLAQEGGHCARRIFHAGDHTGQAIMEALIDAMSVHDNVTVFEYHIAVSLITQSELHTPGDNDEVLGAYVLDETREKIDTFLAKAVILATGGAGKVYRYTTNPETATGDGIAMAYRAGARCGNLEFYQFHPTLLYHHKVNNFLISEALRGEGAHLLNPMTQERFMTHYAPEKMELATRDIVARAIFTEIEKGNHNYVYLDIRHQKEAYLKNRFPMIFETLMKLDINMSKDLIPVVPAAHYLCGGVLADVHGRTDLKRLYAIGETAFTGLHGANRLASNSLLEGVIMGRLAATKSEHDLKKPVVLQHYIRDWDSQHVTDLRRASQINVHWRGLRGEMTSYAGIVRTEAGLKDLLNLINTRREMIENYYRKHTITRDVIELRNIILVAKLMVMSALNRKESRGGHYREDYPNKLSESADTILRTKELKLHFRD